jgi:hypothetical protein
MSNNVPVIKIKEKENDVKLEIFDDPKFLKKLVLLDPKIRELYEKELKLKQNIKEVELSKFESYTSLLFKIITILLLTLIILAYFPYYIFDYICILLVLKHYNLKNIYHDYFKNKNEK